MQVVAQQKDSVLAEVKVSATKTYTNVTSPLPVQILNRKGLDQINAINVADAVKFFSGVLVKDYGGIGGLKTISVRSLGANHTGVLYDGIMLNDAQGGQIDLGKYRTENVQQISLYIAQPPDILNTAKAFSAGSVLSLTTIDDGDDAKRKHNKFLIGFNTGSFGLLQTNTSAAVALAPKWRLYGDGSFMQSKNNYPFRDYEDAHKIKTRINSDIKAFNGEANIVYQNEGSSRLHIKSFFYQSDRGLPNGIILYNYFANERLGNKDFFVQSNYRKNIGEKTNILLNTKYSYQFQHYQKPAALTTENPYENIFHQYEYYVSGAVKQRLSPVLSASYAVDYFYTKLNRTDTFVKQSLQPFPYPTRHNLLNNMALKAAWHRNEIQLSLLHTLVNNHVQVGDAGKNLQRFSPTISATTQPLENIPLRIRAFYKNIFRVPTFNDLYYTILGNTKLRPEIANQYNVGFSYIQHPSALLQFASMNIDFYHNDVKDKIVAVPRDNSGQWSMLNLGIVKINGMDLSVETISQPVNHWQFSLNGAYTFQHAIDKTDPENPKYNNQIAYTPKHSGSFRLGIDYKNFSLGYSALFSSYRFMVGEVLEQNYLPGWAVSDVNIRYRLVKNKMAYTVFAAANNIFNKQYDIVMYYPMPGFHFRTGIKIAFE